MCQRTKSSASATRYPTRRDFQLCHTIVASTGRQQRLGATESELSSCAHRPRHAHLRMRKPHSSVIFSTDFRAKLLRRQIAKGQSNDGKPAPGTSRACARHTYSIGLRVFFLFLRLSRPPPEGSSISGDADKNGSPVRMGASEFNLSSRAHAQFSVAHPLCAVFRCDRLYRSDCPI
jgi:hypothetical protein